VRQKLFWAWYAGYAACLLGIFGRLPGWERTALVLIGGAVALCYRIKLERYERQLERDLKREGRELLEELRYKRQLLAECEKGRNN
jgi:hypothetical protein